MFSECERNEEVEDCNHWVLQCPRWESERPHLLTSVEAQLLKFASLTDDIQSAAITDLGCENRGIVQLIYLVWTARFGRFNITISVDVVPMGVFDSAYRVMMYK